LLSLRGLKSFSHGLKIKVGMELIALTIPIF
jgi:hypothetical protein